MVTGAFLQDGRARDPFVLLQSAGHPRRTIGLPYRTTALMAGIGLLVISGVLFIDWRQLPQRKKLRPNFAIWKT
jgi:hypothetical protein